MAPRYTITELQAVLQLKSKYGRIDYAYPPNLTAEFYALTGKERSHGALYMVSWRLDAGYYDRRLGRKNPAA